jgi:polar amino acid transport system substrate-binding protein
LAQTVYKVGSTPTGQPFTFLDVKTNKIQGMMVDLVTEIGTDAGFQVDIQPVPFTALIPSLTGGRIDIMSAAVTITPQRAELVDFTQPIFPYHEGMIVLKTDDTPYKTLADLQGQVVGVQGGTTYEAMLRRDGKFAEIKTYDSIADIMRDVQLGRIKAGFADDPIVRYRLNQDKSSAVKVVNTYEPRVNGDVAMGVKKGNKELLDKLNAGIAKLKANGRVQALQEKWGLR